MCTWGTTVTLDLTIPAEDSHTGEAYVRPVEVDACIAPIVRALNDAGVPTRACCCGHGKRPGNIALADGRELVVVPDYETGRAVDRFLDSIGAEPINP